MRHRRSSGAAAITQVVFLGVVVAIAVGRWLFGWGFGILTNATDLGTELEDRGYEVVDVDKGHFKGWLPTGNNCGGDWDQWHATVVTNDGRTATIEICTNERFLGFGSPRVQIYER